ncbi:PQQ-dependent catabolism-associated CXXCW motif protein [Acuticoccus sp. I52.16.1]|uniref:PQQ-dependent catabolism-associated CXXCW motif protein n=1 Tax=Acuticoccus sp. I52.16.1 TaxID=2928472 RepID=UPI00352FC0AA
MAAALVAAAVVAAGLGPTPAAAEPAASPSPPGAVAEPAGYRGPPYRAPVPSTLSGAEVLTTDAARALWQRKAATFVDTLPTPRRPDKLPEGTLWRPQPRADIPGSVWLANTGYDRLSSDMEAYFAAALAQITGGDPSAPLVFYCLAECWMSWNAAKRALAAGYDNVRWYPQGTDGWAAAGLPLEPRHPYELAP